MPPSGSALEFAAPARYQLLRRLGAGGYGVVYEALDRDRDERVALKTLHDLTPEALYRFKREFRALADVRHDNLVRLHDLVSEGEQWCFTMELVEGVDFLDGVRAGPHAPTTAPGDPRRSIDGLGHTAPIAPADLAALARRAPSPEPRPPADPTRLRLALRQLAAGVVALHRRGMLHRDLKPSNVMITAAGRVVILDFGLVVETRARGSGNAQIVGTVEYMAPEQAAGQTTGPAADWYSVGVMLFEALTGTLPFTGTLLEMLGQRIAVDAPAVRARNPEAPADLATLCMALLARDPDERPPGDEILALLHAELARPPDLTTPPPATSGALPAPLRGRDDELAALFAALRSVGPGSAALLDLHGASGLGKSALLTRFLADLERRGAAAVILAGRCHERESVPYRGVDSLIDALAHDLRARPDAEVRELCPPQLATLARLFPVLRRVPAIARLGADDDPGLAPHERRQRAFEALRALLARMAATGPVVLAIDDLHWGDVDSAALLRELLAPPDPPPLLLIACYRSEPGDRGCVAALRADLPAHPQLLHAEVELRPLAPGPAAALARTLLAGSPRVGEAAAIARESGGNPLVLTELCHFVRGSVDRDLLADAPSFAAILALRLAQLAPPARALLTVVAVAGEPIDPQLAAAVAGHPDEPPTTLALLRREHLLRSHRVGGQTTVEAFHDRVRAAVVAAVEPAQRRAIHRALAEALAAAPTPDHERLHRHFEAADEPARAARHALAAAALAAAALAFDRAAALYRVALAHADPQDRADLEVRLGDALASDGRGGEAADAYLRAAESHAGEAALELLRRAGFERLRSGQIDEGIAVLQRVLASVDMRLSPTRGRALASLLRHRLALALGGLRFVERPEAAIPGELLRRADVAWSVGASGLGMVDDLAAGEFQSLALRLALRAGEPLRVGRALAGEAAFSAVDGTRSARRTARLLHTARTLAERLDRPQARGTVAMTAGIAAYLEGRFAASASACRAAESLLRTCPDGAWDLINAQLFGLHAQVYLGELAAVGERITPLLREAERRGNLYLLASLRNGPTHLHWLARGAPDELQAGVDEAARRWSTRGVQVQHYWQLHARCDLDLHRGDPWAALERLRHRWPDLGNLLRIQHVRIEALHLRGRCTLAAADADPHRERRVLADARAIEAERTPWGDVLAQLLRAGVAARRGDVAAAHAHLAEAIAASEPADMALHAAAARRRRGELPGPDAAAWRERADTWLLGQGVTDTPRLLATLIPGFPAGPR